MTVSVKGISKIYGKQTAVNTISFEVKKGEVVGLLGPNGAGKSTTMKMITGYIKPNGGTIEVCGLDVHQHSLRIRKKTGYLPEHNPLYEDMYVLEFLRFIGKLHGLSKKILKSNIEEVIEMTGLLIERHKKIGALSKGYRQRVGLAQALLHDPEVLILDEPTSGLDPNQITEIRTLIRNTSKNKAVILSTHLMQEVKAVCDRAVIINRGEIVADKSITELENTHADKVIIIAEFAEEINPGLLSENIDCIEKTELIKEQNTSSVKYIITAKKDSDPRAEIFRVSTGNNLNIIGLKKEESSLEEVFKQLTEKSNNA